jgi:hypothetical protein
LRPGILASARLSAERRGEATSAGGREAWQVTCVGVPNPSIRDAAGNGYQLPRAGGRGSFEVRLLTHIPIDIEPDTQEKDGFQR